MRWVELPNCKPLPPNLSVLEIPLEDDLSNASIATCKTGMPSDWDTPAFSPPAGLNAAGMAKLAFGMTFNPMIYDPVMHEHYNEEEIDFEHQVTQQANGQVNPTEGTDGPTGSFLYPPGTPMTDTQWAPLAAVQMRPRESQMPPPLPRFEYPYVNDVTYGNKSPYDNRLNRPII